MTEIMDELLGFNKFSEFSTLEEFEKHLAFLMSSGAYIFHEDGESFPIFGRALVERIGALKIEIYPKEHAPPHFHVKGPDVDATFHLTTGRYIDGRIDGRSRDVIEYWFGRARLKLIGVWNKTRPDDCPVGPVVDENDPGP